MSKVQAFAKNLKKLDLFSTSTFLRYKADEQYATNTGMVTSLVVIAVLVTLFASQGLKTVKKQIITASFTAQNDVDPNELTITTSPDGGFMFMVGMPGYDLSNSSYKVFNFTLYQEYFSSVMKPINKTAYTMVPCTVQHLAFDSTIQALYSKLNMNTMLCPPLGQEFKIRGKKTSDIYAQFRVGIEKCNIGADPACVNSSQFASLTSGQSQFDIIFPFINTKINPGNSEYKSVYLEDRNMVSFSEKFGAKVYVGIQEDIVQTDVSLTPFEQTQSQNITTVPNLFETYYYMNSAGSFSYMDLIFTKEPTTTTYSRSFNKVDNYFSYVGGLIGIIIGLIFIMGFFTERSYELSVGSRLFSHTDKEGIPSQSFHLGYYFSSLIANVLNFFNCPPKWQKTQMFLNYCQEMQQQLDITYILRKLLFLQAVVSKILQPHQLEAIYMRKKMTLDKAKEIRRKHYLPQLIKQLGQNDEKNEPSKSKQIDFNSQVSKQQIFYDFQDEERKRKSSGHHFDPPSEIERSQNVSVIQVQLEDQDNFDEVRCSINQVQNDSKEGKLVSKRIMDDIDPSLIKRLQLDKISKSRITHAIKIKPLGSGEEFSQYKQEKQEPVKIEDLQFEDSKQIP